MERGCRPCAVNPGLVRKCDPSSGTGVVWRLSCKSIFVPFEHAVLLFAMRCAPLLRGSSCTTGSPGVPYNLCLSEGRHQASRQHGGNIDITWGPVHVVSRTPSLHGTAHLVANGPTGHAEEELSGRSDE